MISKFEANGHYAIRTKTGARLQFSSIPKEFSGFDFFYENPGFGINFGFLAILLYETLPLKYLKNGRIFSQPVCNRVILQKGQLESNLKGPLARINHTAAIEQTVDDVYELLAECLITGYDGLFNLREAGVKILIYESDFSSFMDALAIPDNVRLGPEAVSKYQAKLVFPT